MNGERKIAEWEMKAIARERHEAANGYADNWRRDRTEAADNASEQRDGERRRREVGL